MVRNVLTETQLKSYEKCKRVVERHPVTICPSCGGEVKAFVKEENITHSIWKKHESAYCVSCACVKCKKEYYLTDSMEFQTIK
jgi:uncharacterized protein with PIN domain